MAAGLLALFLAAIGIFLLPFAFPTPPPVIARFLTTARFSPNGDHVRDIARVSVQLNQAARVSVDVNDCRGHVLRELISDRYRRRGMVHASWGGRDSHGARLPDGSYCLSLEAYAGSAPSSQSGGRKRWKSSRRIVIDTTPPRISSLAVGSAALLGRGIGECRVAVSVADDARVTVRVLRANGARLTGVGPRPLRAGRALSWSWSGRGPGGRPVAPGVYRVAVTVADTLGNHQTAARSCWVGHLIGRAVPARPRPGGMVRARLTTIAGRGLSPATRVTLRLRRKVADPGASLADPLGKPVGAATTGRMDRTAIRLPRTVAPARLWLTARTSHGVALIPLSGR